MRFKEYEESTSSVGVGLEMKTIGHSVQLVIGFNDHRRLHEATSILVLIKINCFRCLDY